MTDTLTNEELQEAINKTFSMISLRIDKGDEANRAMLEQHLEYLLDVQRMRSTLRLGTYPMGVTP